MEESATEYTHLLVLRKDFQLEIPKLFLTAFFLTKRVSESVKKLMLQLDFVIMSWKRPKLTPRLRLKKSKVPDEL